MIGVRIPGTRSARGPREVQFFVASFANILLPGMLGRIGDPRCRPVLESVLVRGSLRVRLAARRALTALGVSMEATHERS